ncbi:putative reverse transcriptase domain, reverse transcriptase zinc-binding domain protein, partial [Tanacetum coccineum]
MMIMNTNPQTFEQPRIFRTIHPQKPKGKDGILKKLDRVLTNLEFNDLFQGAHAIFQPYRIFDHAPAVLKIPWKNVKKLRFELDVVQRALDLDPSNNTLREEEAVNVQAFNEAILLEEMFLRQKAKIDWLRDGDSNSAYFHKAVKSRVSRSRIDVVSNSDGVLFENEHVPEAFVAHYEAFLGHPGTVSDVIMTELISPNQFAFVPGRSIADNILLTQEIMHNYHLNHGTLRCAFKVDIQKAYDTVDWCFLRKVLIGFGFHDRMVGWIMECVTTTSFSICVNGSLHGYFKGKRGLRQGDPLSPYLFTLIMEILTLIIKRRVCESDVFAYHRYCSKLDLVNLCFADDLFLFAHGNTNSARVIMESLEEFKIVSGL